MERYAEEEPSPVPEILKPLARVNYVLGTFPYLIVLDNRRIDLSRKTFHFYRTIVTYVIVGFAVFAGGYSSVRLLLAPRVFVNGEPLPILGRMVELTSGVYANLITLIILGLMFSHREVLVKFFNELDTYGVTLSMYLDRDRVRRTAKRMYALYGILGFTAAISIGRRTYYEPCIGPVSVFLEITSLDSYFTYETMQLLSSLVVVYLALAKIACIAVVEVVSIALARCISSAVENIMAHLKSEMELWEGQYKGFISSGVDKEDFLNLLATPTTPTPKDKHTLQNELDNYIDQIRELNPGLITASVPDSFKSTQIPSLRPPSTLSYLKSTPGKVLTRIARKFQCIETMQSIMNTVFGHILAINIGLVVGMIVIIKFLVITSFRARFSNDIEINNDFGDGDGNETNWMSDNVNSTNVTTHHHFDSLEWLTFLGVDLSMTIRLGVTIISLSNVYHTSLRFNALMGKAFVTANRLNDELADAFGSTEGGVIGGEAVAKMMMTPTQASSIIAFMNVNNANPVAFTAGGLFVFSRSLLLMIISIVISYLVFLLQA